MKSLNLIAPTTVHQDFHQHSQYTSCFGKGVPVTSHSAHYRQTQEYKTSRIQSSTPVSVFQSLSTSDRLAKVAGATRLSYQQWTLLSLWFFTYFSPNIIRMIKLRKVILAGNIVHIWGKQNAYKILMVQSERKRLLRKRLH
jgi:hypothetical protein